MAEYKFLLTNETDNMLPKQHQPNFVFKIYPVYIQP